MWEREKNTMKTLQWTLGATMTTMKRHYNGAITMNNQAWRIRGALEQGVLDPLLEPSSGEESRGGLLQIHIALVVVQLARFDPLEHLKHWRPWVHGARDLQRRLEVGTAALRFDVVPIRRRLLDALGCAVWQEQRRRRFSRCRRQRRVHWPKLAEVLVVRFLLRRPQGSPHGEQTSLADRQLEDYVGHDREVDGRSSREIGRRCLRPVVRELWGGVLLLFGAFAIVVAVRGKRVQVETHWLHQRAVGVSASTGRVFPHAEHCCSASRQKLVIHVVHH